MRRLFISLIFICTMLLCSCQQGDVPPLRQKVDCIVKIELITHTEENTVVSTLTNDALITFMNEFLKLDCKKRFQPVEDIGELEIRLYYHNGDVDIFGSHANGYIENGEYTLSGWYYYDQDKMVELFEEFSKSGLCSNDKTGNKETRLLYVDSVSGNILASINGETLHNT